MQPSLLLLILFSLLGSPLLAEDPANETKPSLDSRLQKDRSEYNRVIASYKPTKPGNITDLEISAEDILKSLPGVMSVERTAIGNNISKRIIHLRDWHFVSESDFAKDLRSKETLSDAQISSLYAAFLLEVELVQVQQQAILELLRRHHGLDHVCIEGLTEKDVDLYRLKLSGLRKSGEKISELQKLKDDLDATEDQVLIGQIDAAAADYRLERLQAGAAGQLYVSGHVTDIRPSEKLAEYQAANPLKTRSVDIDEKAIERRQTAIVSVATSKIVSFIILGGGHDLSDNLPPNVEYLRVTTGYYREFSGD